MGGRFGKYGDVKRKALIQKRRFSYKEFKRSAKEVDRQGKFRRNKERNF